MDTLHALRLGMHRALAEPKMLLVLWLLNALAALPATWIVADAIRADVGASYYGETLERGFDMDWLAEYRHRNDRGVPAMLSPVRTSGQAVYANLDAWFGGRLLDGPPAIKASLLLFGLVWVVVQGGIIARLSRPATPYRAATFLADGGRTALRFGMLVLLTGGIYLVLFRLAGAHFDRLSAAFRDAGTEGELMLRVLLWGALFVAALHVVRLVADYAKIAIVQDGIRFVPLALWQGLRFVWARPMRTIGIYAGFGAATLVLLGAYAAWAPGPGSVSTVGTIAAVVVAQLFVAARLALRVGLLAAESTTYRDTGGM